MGRKPAARAKILDAASQLFWLHGYEGVGVDEICRFAGVNKGSLYHHHKDKEDLAVAVIEYNLARTIAAVDEELQGRTGRARVLGYLDWMIARQTDNAGRHGAFSGCPFGKMAVGQGGSSPIGVAVSAALSRIATLVATALAQMFPRLPVRRRLAIAEEFTMLWQGALVLSEARNSAEPLRQARALTARSLAALTEPRD